MDDFDRRFAKAPFNDKDLHRPLGAQDDIDEAFAWTEERTVSQNQTLQYDKMLFILEPTPVIRPLAPSARRSTTVQTTMWPGVRMRHLSLTLPPRSPFSWQNIGFI